MYLFIRIFLCFYVRTSMCVYAYTCIYMYICVQSYITYIVKNKKNKKK